LHDDGMLGIYRGRKFGEIPDGTSNTILHSAHWIYHFATFCSWVALMILHIDFTLLVLHEGEASI
jgi:uncharacterized membrane protein